MDFLDEFTEACCVCSRALHKDQLDSLRQVNGQYCCSEHCYNDMTTTVKIDWPSHPDADEDGKIEMPLVAAKALYRSTARVVDSKWKNYPIDDPSCAITGEKPRMNSEDDGVAAVSFSIHCGYPSRYDTLSLYGFLSDEALQQLVLSCKGSLRVINRGCWGDQNHDMTKEIEEIFERKLKDD